jgi:hypothetical protein
MSEYMVEVYVPRAGAAEAAPAPDHVSRVAEDLTREGRRVQLVRAILVPEDETCLYLFRAQTGDVVREAAMRAGLRFEHVVEVAQDWKEGSALRFRDSQTAFQQQHNTGDQP